MLIKYYKKVIFFKKIFLFFSFLFSIFLFIIIFYKKEISDGNIIFIVDVSHSMNVKVGTGKISRLDLGKYVIEYIVNNNKNNFKKFGVILFSNKSFYYVPPTFDKDTFLNFVDSLQTNIIPGGGNNLQEAINLFYSVNNIKDHIILITDGDNLIINTGFKLNTNVIVVGVGGDISGKVLYPDGTIMYNNKGNIVYSKLNKEFIQKIGRRSFFVKNYNDIISNLNFFNINKSYFDDLNLFLLNILLVIFLFFALKF